MNFSKSELNIVIPVLNGSRVLPRLLGQLCGVFVLVVDGGSSDDSVALAKGQGAEVLETRAGRGWQLSIGAGQTVSEWILFLHADSQLSEGWRDEVIAFISAREKSIAVFRFGLDDEGYTARLLEWLVAKRCRLFGLPYGDQGLLIHRDMYLKAGGFKDVAMMEDVALIRKFSRHEIAFLKTRLVTSAVRFRKRGYVVQMIRNVIFLGLYFLGVSPHWLARFY